MIEKAEAQERQAAREEAQKAHTFAEKLRKHFSDGEPSSLLDAYMLDRAESEEYEALARLMSMADEHDEKWPAIENTVRTGTAETRYLALAVVGAWACVLVAWRVWA